MRKLRKLRIVRRPRRVIGPGCENCEKCEKCEGPREVRGPGCENYEKYEKYETVEVTCQRAKSANPSSESLLTCSEFGYVVFDAFRSWRSRCRAESPLPELGDAIKCRSCCPGTSVHVRLRKIIRHCIILRVQQLNVSRVSYHIDTYRYRI